MVVLPFAPAAIRSSGSQCHEDTIPLQCKANFEKHVPDHPGKTGVVHMTTSMPIVEQPSHRGIVGYIGLKISVTTTEYSSQYH